MSIILIFTYVIKLISISLSLFILIHSFGISLSDVSQIDEFVEHAQFHSERYGDNVFVFISKHYGELKAAHDKEQQEGNEDHENLPFKHQSHISCLTDFAIHQQKVSLRAPEFLQFKVHTFHYQAPSSSVYLEGILQPPRLS